MIPYAFRGAADRIQLPKRVQFGVDSGTVATSTIVRAFATAPQGGNLLLCWVSFDNGAGGSITSITDTQSNKWVKVHSVVVGGDNQRNELWYCEGCRGGPNTVTVTPDTAHTFESMALVEVSGIAKTNALDTNAIAQATSAAPNSGTVNPTTFGQYCFGGGYVGGVTITPATGWTTVDNSTNVANILAEQILSTPQAIAFSGTKTSGTWAASIATFKAAGLGAV